MNKERVSVTEIDSMIIKNLPKYMKIATPDGFSR